MKKIYTLIASTLLALNSFSQDCVDFRDIDISGWIIDPGVSIYESEKINLVSGGIFDYMGATDENISFFGYLHIDINSECKNNTLEFTGFNSHIVVDGDTVNTEDPRFLFPYSTPSYSIDYDPINFTYSVEGDFEQVIIGYSTNIVDKICLTESCIGMSSETVQISELNVYPNPATNILNIDADFEKLEIMNLLGETVLTVNQQVQSVDISELSIGTYFIKSTINNTSSITKFIKK